MYQLCNLIGRRNIVTHPKNDVNSCEDFFLSIDILAAAMELGGMESLASIPLSTHIAEDYWLESADERRKALMSFCQSLVSKFVNFKFLVTQPKRPCQQQSEDKVYAYACHLKSRSFLHGIY